MPVLQVENLTKDYGFNRGVFDVTFNVEKGEVYGFLGPNGAGKTTTIRHIMGFSRPHKGHTYVNGQNSWKHYHQIQRSLGYLPGEIALPERLTGTQFIKMMADLRKMTDMTYTQELIKRFELEPAGGLKRMALGMKRKLAIVTAFMHDPDILVLDEPTSGLDPIMQDTFIEFIKSEKSRGKTILLSSHIFSEVDATCDKISIIKDGRLVSSFVADDLRHSESKTYKLEFSSKTEFERFIHDAKQSRVPGSCDINIGSAASNTTGNDAPETGFGSSGVISGSFEIASTKEYRNQVHIHVDDVNVNEFIAIISGYGLKFFTEIKFTLEDYFMKFYDKRQVV